MRLKIVSTSEFQHFGTTSRLKASKITFHTDKNCLLDPRRSTAPLSDKVRRVG